SVTPCLSLQNPLHSSSRGRFKHGSLLDGKIPQSRISSRWKSTAGWTGANEKTVKNWFSGRYGPSGEHLAVLVRHSDEVLNAFLVMAGRQELMVAIKLAAAEQAIMDLLMAVRSLAGDSGDSWDVKQKLKPARRHR
ncbi:MAG: hypothetical protein WBA48_05985, partial [Xanthobacteraceae bacterium]